MRSKIFPSGVDELATSLVVFGRDIKLAHSVFALPFAFAALFLAPVAWPSIEQIALLIVCMVSARSFAMGINRSLDADIDAENPRTRSRMIPSGQITRDHSLRWSAGFGLVFILAAFGLNSLAGYLSVPLLLILGGYTLTKRVSWLCHLYLGLCLGFAPVAVYIALGYEVAPVIYWLALAVTAWTAGFDIIYSLQDISFDRSQRLCSVPAVFGVRRALWISRALFVSMLICLLAVGWWSQAGIIYGFGVAVLSVILAYEHWLIREAAFHPEGKSEHINAAFFNLNAWVSVLFLLFVIADVMLRPYV